MQKLYNYWLSSKEIMTKKVDWKYFERVVAAIHYAESQGATVTWNDTIQGRQFDVTIRFKYGLHDYLTVIECKNYSNKVAVEKIDALATKARDVNANKAIIVSSSGYQSGCFEVANRHGIKLLTLNEKVEKDTDELIADVTPALNVYDVRLKLAHSNKEYILEDIGGKLHYLMNNVKIESGEIVQSPNQIIYEWQLTRPDISIDSENIISIPLPENTISHIPHEKSELVTALLFKCKFIKAFISKGPFIDNHIREALNTTYELVDESGNITHKISPSELKIGFDTKLEVGKFYENSRLHNYYYCEHIEENTVSWILVESYQHGHLFQARMKVDLKYSFYYVEVKDKNKLNNLKLLIERFKR